MPTTTQSVLDPYEAQLRIRREGEERNNAQRELNSWLSELREKQPAANSTRPHSNVKDKVNVTNKSTTSNGSNATFEDERLRGNDYFAKGHYQEAIDCYTHCIADKKAQDMPMSIVFSNRAMAHLKLKNWTNAEADATNALAIDPYHSKSYQRRCVARLSLGKLRAAMIDACAAEDCLGTNENKDAKSLDEVRRLQQKVQRALEKAVKSAPKRILKIEVN